MRIANGVFAVLLILFAVVQYNDPDGLFWLIVYGVGAVWCALAALRPGALSGILFGLFGLTFAAAVAGLVYFWPTTDRWWMQEVWWETETAREGMGMMILIVGLVLAGIVALRRA